MLVVSCTFRSSFPPSCSFSPFSVILEIHQVTVDWRTSRRWSSLLSVLSLSRHLHICRFLPPCLFLRLPLVWRNLFPWRLLLLQMRWLQHLIWEQLLWSGRILTCRDSLLLQYPFSFYPLLFLSHPLSSFPQHHFLLFRIRSHAVCSVCLFFL